MRMSKYLLILLALNGCSFVEDFDKFHVVTDSDGSVEQPITPEDGGVSILDSATVEYDSGSPIAPVTDSGMIEALDASTPELIDAGSVVNVPDSSTVYPHGCAPDTFWCQTHMKCWTAHQLDINFGSCENCKKDLNSGVWTCVE